MLGLPSGGQFLKVGLIVLAVLAVLKFAAPESIKAYFRI